MQLVCMEFLLAKLIIVSRFNNIRCSNVVAFLNILSQTHRRVFSSEISKSTVLSVLTLLVVICCFFFFIARHNKSANIDYTSRNRSSSGLAGVF